MRIFLRTQTNGGSGIYTVLVKISRNFHVYPLEFADVSIYFHLEYQSIRCSQEFVVDGALLMGEGTLDP